MLDLLKEMLILRSLVQFRYVSIERGDSGLLFITHEKGADAGPCRHRRCSDRTSACRGTSLLLTVGNGYLLLRVGDDPYKIF